MSTGTHVNTFEESYCSRRGRTSLIRVLENAPEFLDSTLWHQKKYVRSDICDADKMGKECEEKNSEWDQYDNAAVYLGPNLWEKNITYDQNFKLEHMDLDEFLIENLESDSLKRTFVETTTIPNPVESPASINSISEQSQPMAPGSPLEGSKTSSSSPYGSQPYQSVDYLTSSESCPGSPRTPQSPLMQNDSQDDLKPQPVMKKNRKQYVPDELKDDRYWARRRKNNMAAKRSRDARRMKENQIALRANYLEKENCTLKSELQKTQTLLETMKKRLSAYESVD